LKQNIRLKLSVRINLKNLPPRRAKINLASLPFSVMTRHFAARHFIITEKVLSIFIQIRAKYEAITTLP
jgi:hypothetical protein